MNETIVIFDTNLIRHYLHNDNNIEEKFKKLFEYKDKAIFRISETAYAELITQLYDKKIDIYLWQSRSSLLKDLVDKELPIQPLGIEMSLQADLFTEKYKERFREKEFYPLIYWQKLWEHLINIKILDNLCDDITYVDSGQQFKVDFKPEKFREAFEDEREKWIKFFKDARERIQNFIDDFNLENQTNCTIDAVDLDIVTRIVEYQQTEDYTDFTKIDGMNKSAALYLYNNLKEKGGYNPESKKRENDVFDFSMLQVFSIGAYLCTGDKKFYKHVKNSNSSQKDMILDIDGLIDMLEQNT